MQAIKREFFLFLTISALVFTSALVWGTPFTMSAAAQSTNSAQQPTQQQPNAQTPSYGQSQGQMEEGQQSSRSFTGTVVKSGSSYELQTTAGETYKLSDAPNAASFVGKTVTVKGQLNSQSKSIQVSSIEPH
jgi:Protein of unknown function (DUF5818)